MCKCGEAVKRILLGVCATRIHRVTQDMISAEKSYDSLPNFTAADAMRLLGIPRTAAAPLASHCGKTINQPLPKLRETLVNLTEADWKTAVGQNGLVYRRVWRILEGVDDA